MNKRILVSEEEKNSILNMHESFKNRGVIKEDEMTSNTCDVKITQEFKIRTWDTGATLNGKTPSKMTLKVGQNVSLTRGKKIYSEESGAGDSLAGGHTLELSCDGIKRQNQD